MEDKDAWERLRNICKFYNINLQGWERCNDDDLLYLSDRITFELVTRPEEHEGKEVWDKYRMNRKTLQAEYYWLLKKIQRRYK